jgi:RES domain-containing protein
MILWRLYRKAFGPGLAGLGGIYTDGRWHTKGHYCTYLGGSASIVVLEKLVHLDPINFESDLMLGQFEIETEVEDGLVALNELWSGTPVDDIEKTRQVGDSFLKLNQKCLLKVPSVIVPEEYNYLFNPKHADAADLSLIHERAFTFDDRLL